VSDRAGQPPNESPPRAFTQGVGTVFQFAGVSLFLAMMFICCSSSLLSKDTATRGEWQSIGWGSYTAQLATTLTVTLGVFFGIALAGLGLGLQAQNRRTPWLAVMITGIASIFWIVQTVFYAGNVRSIVLTGGCALLALMFIVLFGLALSAAREMWSDPPPKGFEILPADYKVPYSHMHQDPPDVRLAAELQQRRERLEVQQKELEALEERIRRRMKQNDT
jgi:signal transduction histidine kinase